MGLRSHVTERRGCEGRKRDRKEINTRDITNIIWRTNANVCERLDLRPIQI
jgi:hypothetical protein